MRPGAVRGWLTWLLGVSALVIMYLPVIAMVFLSFHESSGGENTSLSLAPWGRALGEADLLQGLKVSLGVASISAGVAMLVGVCAALVAWQGPMLLRRLILGAMGVLLVIPDLVLGIGLLMWYRLLGIPSGAWMVVGAHVTASLALVVMTLTTRLSSFDESLIDAARDLGASPVKVFMYVILPILGPGILGSMMLAFTYSFDDFILAFLLGGTGSESSTLSVSLFNITRIHPRPEVFAWGVLMMLPLVLWIMSRLPYFRGVRER